MSFRCRKSSGADGILSVDRRSNDADMRAQVVIIRYSIQDICLFFTLINAFQDAAKKPCMSVCLLNFWTVDWVQVIMRFANDRLDAVSLRCAIEVSDHGAQQHASCLSGRPDRDWVTLYLTSGRSQDSIACKMGIAMR